MIDDAYRNETPQEIKNEQATYRYFLLSIGLKGLISAAEVIAGILVLVIPHHGMYWLVALFTTGPLSFATPESIAAYLDHVVLLVTASTIFVSVYLLSRGFIKLFLIIALIKNKLWAYPISLAVLGLFMLYQCYQIVTTHSIEIILITLFDSVVVYFIWKEYQIVKHHHGKRIQ